MSEKRRTRPSDLEPVENQNLSRSSSGKKRRKTGKKADYGTTIKCLYGIAIVLAVAACAIIGVKTYEDLTAEKSASALLSAYKEMETATPTATTSPTAQESTEEPEATPTPAPDMDDEADSHRVDAESDLNVDETANYVQPDAPEVSEVEKIIQQIVESVGDDGVIGTIEIPKTGQEYPIIGKWSYKLLKISICRYQGGEPNESGNNLVLIGHNYKSGAHFGNLKNLEVGDEIFLTAKNGDRVRYEVYEMKGIAPDQFSALKEYKGDAGLTLLTCKDNGNNRLVVRCMQKEAPASVSATTEN